MGEGGYDLWYHGMCDILYIAFLVSADTCLGHICISFIESMIIISHTFQYDCSEDLQNFRTFAKKSENSLWPGTNKNINNDMTYCYTYYHI